MARVLQVFQSGGGVAANVRQLTLGLGAYGYQMEVAGPLRSEVGVALARDGVTVHRFPFRAGYASPGRDVVALQGLTGLLRRGGYDLLHCHSGKAAALGRVAARIAGVHAVYSPHSFPFVGDFPPLRGAVSKGVERLLAPLAAGVVCVCEAERQVALRHGLAPAERLHVVYNGCEPCPSDVTVDPRLAEMRAEGPVAAAILGLRAQKSIDTLLRAAPLLFQRMPNARLAVVGNGPLRGELEACAASLGLDGDERFAFLPFTPPAARYLLASDLYVLPSAWEAFPIGVLEAQACGVPQVATDVGGTGEAVSADTGLLVAPHDPPALAVAIGDLLADGERRARLGRASRERHKARFQVERVVAETAAVYDQVLGCGR